MSFNPFIATVGNQPTPLPVSAGGTGLTTSPLTIPLGGNGQTTDPLPPFEASDGGLLAWSFDGIAATASTVLPTAGSINLVRVNLRTAISVTNVIYQVVTIGSGLTTGQCFAGLYNSGGTLIGTSADQAAAWAATTGIYTNALTSGPFSAGPGFVWVALLFNGTTGPAIGRATTSTTLVNIGLSAANSRFAHASTAAQTSLTTFTPSANVQTGPAYWVALS